MTAVATVSVALGGCLLACSVVAGVGQVAVSRAQADAVADLAALAAAASLSTGSTHAESCERAAAVTAAHTGRPVTLTRCAVAGRDVTVEVRAPVRLGGRLVRLDPGVGVSGRSRAGPAP